MTIKKANYIAIKTRLKALQNEIAKKEKGYIKEHKIINPDGTIPQEFSDIENDDEFDKAMEWLDSDKEMQQLNDAVTVTLTDLHKAENTLIEYAIEIAPAEVKDEIRAAANRSVVYRQKIIDTID